MNAKPNILWIVADHQVHATRPPGFDRFPLQRALGRLGTRFDRAYSVLPICSPARASMLTGLYPHAHGLTENDGRFGGREGLDAGDWMIQHALRDAGYRCGWFGKWHVNNRACALDFGFEGFSLPGYGYPYGADEYRAYLRRQGLQEPLARILVRNESGQAAGSGIDLCANAKWFDYVSGVAALEGPVQAHEAFFVADLAARWIESRNEPFFLRVDPWGPHPPYLLAEPYLGMLDDADVVLPPSFYSDLRGRPAHHRRYRDYWRDAVGLDEAHWRRLYRHALEHVILVESALCALLDRIDLDNTLVVFNSDHGDAVGASGGVANKGDLMIEATMQIPLLMAGPGVAAGQPRAQLVSNLDIPVTLLALCGIDSDRRFHGMSLAPLLQDDSAEWRRGLMAQHYGLQEPIVQRAWYRDDWKLVAGEDGSRELYDLAADAHELENLARRGEYRATLAAMESELARAMLAAGDPCAAILGKDVSTQ